MLLLPDLYQLCGSCYGSHQNVFAAAFPMEKQLILFDTGLDAADLGIIRDNLLLWGLDSFQISHVFLTHSHFDHTGNARSFLRNGAQLLIGEEDADAVENGSAGTIPYCYGVPFPACPVSHRLVDREKSMFTVLLWNAIRFPDIPGEAWPTVSCGMGKRFL